MYANNDPILAKNKFQMTVHMACLGLHDIQLANYGTHKIITLTTMLWSKTRLTTTGSENYLAKQISGKQQLFELILCIQTTLPPPLY